MTAKYTPAPWVNDHGLVNGRESCAKFGDTSSFDLFDTNDYPAEMRDEMMATAQLISAAPDLLEALKAARPHVVFVNTIAGDDVLRARLEQLDAAIAKAEGTTP